MDIITGRAPPLHEPIHSTPFLRSAVVPSVFGVRARPAFLSAIVSAAVYAIGSGVLSLYSPLQQPAFSCTACFGSQSMLAVRYHRSTRVTLLFCAARAYTAVAVVVVVAVVSLSLSLSLSRSLSLCLSICLSVALSRALSRSLSVCGGVGVDRTGALPGQQDRRDRGDCRLFGPAVERLWLHQVPARRGRHHVP